MHADLAGSRETIAAYEMRMAELEAAVTPVDEGARYAAEERAIAAEATAQETAVALAETQAALFQTQATLTEREAALAEAGAFTPDEETLRELVATRERFAGVQRELSELRAAHETLLAEVAAREAVAADAAPPGPTTDDLDAVEARAAQAEADLGAARAQLSGLGQAHEALRERLEELQNAGQALGQPVNADAAEAVARAEDAEAKLGAATAQLQNLEEAHEALRERVEELQRASSDSGSRAASSSGDVATAELEALVAELELRLEQSEARARSAYTAAEAAEATLRMAREGDFAPSAHSDDEYRQLKRLLEAATRRADEAERTARTLEADLAAVRSGVDPNAVTDPMAPADSADGPGVADAPAPADGPGITDAWAADSAGSKGSGLRNKLAAAAAGKKPRSSERS